MDLSPIIISLKTASLSIVVTFFLGILAAWLVLRISNQRVKLVVDSILTLPLVLPPTVMGFFLLYVFGINRSLGKFFIDFFSIKIAFSWGATVIAAVAISFPLMYRSALGAFEQVEQDYIYAARTLGMSETMIFRKIIFPLALPGVASGGVLSFARGMGEFGATAMLAGNIAGRTRTLPLAIYSAVAAGDMDTAYQYVVIIVIICFFVILAMNWFTYRGKR